MNVSATPSSLAAVSGRTFRASTNRTVKKEAAIRAGIKVADIHVGNYSDEQMIRVYAVENATQRGNTSTAMGGSVASAVRFIAKDLLVLGSNSQFWEKGNRGGPADLGEPTITAFLHDVQGINKSATGLALGQLKASAVRFIAKDLLIHTTHSQFWERDKERQADPANLGEPIITAFLHDVPGINKSATGLALGQLKGDFESPLKI